MHLILQPTNLIFSIYFKDNPNPEKIYSRMQTEFLKLLHVAHLDERKDNSIRHKITLHSFRRFVKTTISDNAGSDYSEWFLGHDHSVYWGKKEPERRRIYTQKCMPSLTILDYTAIDKTQKNIQSELQVKDKQIHELMQFKQEMQILLNEPRKFINMLEDGMKASL